MGKLEKLGLNGDIGLLNSDMARATVANKVGELIGFFVAFCGEISIGNNVMDIQFTSEFLFGNPAFLALVLVALAGCVTLLAPVCATIAHFTAQPVGAIRAGTILGYPSAFTFVTAKLSLAVANMKRRASEGFAANGACAINTGVSRIIFAYPIVRLPLSHASTGTKMLSGLEVVRAIFLECCAAISASYFDPFALGAPNCDFATAICAELARPASFPRKLFATFRTCTCKQHKNLLLNGLTVLAKGTPIAQQEGGNCNRFLTYGQAVCVPLAA